MDVSVSTGAAEEYVASVTVDAHSTHEAHTSIAETSPENNSHHDTHSAPTNLPTIGYNALFDHTETAIENEEDLHLTALENKAHKEKVLLSSDAMRFFIGHVASSTEQNDMFETIVKKARVSFPSEDGWVVLNLERMEKLVEEMNHTKVRDAEVVNTSLENSIPFEPMTSGSLAEAIVSKNIVAAYQLIANRPMVALADATSELNAVYRSRKGEAVAVSDLLQEHTRELSTDTLEALTLALTSALDGTYQTEEEAVKMAILKAVQVIS